MPSYAILGATGNTGRALITYLSSNPINTLNLYARSKEKLLTQNPSFSPDLPSNIHLFIGQMTDTQLLASCIKNVDSVFCVIASNDPVPKTHLAQDAAHATISALEEAKHQNDGSIAGLPRLIFLSAAPASDVFVNKMPPFIKWMLWKMFSDQYWDLQLAEEIVRKDKEWARAIFVYPGGLEETETRVLGYKVIDGNEDMPPRFLGYGDLARGMVEIADREGGDWEAVSVVPVGVGAKVAYGRLLWLQLRGLLFATFPWLHGMI